MYLGIGCRAVARTAYFGFGLGVYGGKHGLGYRAWGVTGLWRFRGSGFRVSGWGLGV